MNLEDFNYSLPKQLIAKRPNVKKKSKVLIHDKRKIIEFDQILNEFNKDDVIIFNNTKVIPSIIKGIHDGKMIKLTLLDNYKKYFWNAFIKPAKKVKENTKIEFNKNFYCTITKKTSAIAEVKFNYNYNQVMNYLDKCGDLPLPPYIKTLSDRQLDEKYYQTVFAKNIGAVACPTAGLHFSESLLKKFKNKNIETIFITLHVGAGTFLPLKNEKVTKNILHKERGIITKEVAEKINNAISNKKRIVAVGTTVVRLLEACYCKYGKIRDFNEDTNLFIYPGFKFNVINKLITNFHLPKSSLLILVSAFSGENKIKEIYKFAIRHNMRFFSFGDAMLLDKNEF
ncbi:MAG: tRNA preQ1(34) S-adenosylmethionine ribosyltransferase-isomerase QueA [Pelagibacterales bacterium]|nr:tRNA preQ1(34) S-adenosylmethionine ribosyltransferase-isomerase QueA [Pelagibacterales bacterium]OUU61986.1 MAG: tRNA preQ1(34) S-adenosylmethionine ribosyltransferase-isomerase QueA [Alphaproteobacteria bacterium TMED62]|tara:strand:+ start:7403 stop:8425 length:1023 start_codon:yes stop_codon:yes gene_type:complete